MKQFSFTVGAGRSAIEIHASVKEYHERTPEEHRVAAEVERRVLGEPTPEMFEKPTPKPKRARRKQAA